LLIYLLAIIFPGKMFNLYISQEIIAKEQSRQ